MRIEEIDKLLKLFKSMTKAIANYQAFAIKFVDQEDLQKVNRLLTEMNLLLNNYEYKVRYEDEN